MLTVKFFWIHGPEQEVEANSWLPQLKKCSIWFRGAIFNSLCTKYLQKEILPIFPQETFHPQILSYLFRVGSESKKHLAGKQVIRLISWPWIPTRSRISRGPLCPILHLSPHLSPRESICLHKILSLGRGRRTLTFFPFPPRTFLLVSKGLKVISKSRKRLLQVTAGGSKFATLPPPPSPPQVRFVVQITGPETALVTYGAASRVKKGKTKT